MGKLVLEKVTKNFGGLRAVGDVSFTVNEKVIFGLIGPNGAGKTTVFNLITGVYKHDTGRIRFGTRDLASLAPAQIAGVGIGRTFQNIRLFGQLTVLENLLVACELQAKARLAAAIFRLPVHYTDEEAMERQALELLRVFDLEAMADQAPTSLSYGNQRRLEIARAMMLKPKVLLLDEPAAGMNYGEAEGLKTQIRWLRDTFDLSVVLVEHNMQVVMGVCEEIHVLDHGETIAHGAPDEIRKDAKVLTAYLGEEDPRAAEQAAPQTPPPAPPSAPSASVSDTGADKDPMPSEPAPNKLSDPELADLSRHLTQSLERGFSRPDEEEVAPAVPPPAPVLAEASEPRLKNIDSAWSSGSVKAAPPAPTSAPNIAKLDEGWGDDEKKKEE